MGFATYIEWCHHTFNGWTGCAKVSVGRVRQSPKGG